MGQYYRTLQKCAACWLTKPQRHQPLTVWQRTPGHAPQPMRHFVSGERVIQMSQSLSIFKSFESFSFLSFLIS